MKGLNLSEWAVKHPSFVLFLILASCAAGIHAYLGMGRAEDPSFTIKTMVVSADWPGATSDEFQKQVADPIEEKLQETPYLDYLKTYCVPGRTVIQIFLKDYTPPKAVPDVWYQVRKKIGDIRRTLRNVCLDLDSLPDVVWHARDRGGIPAGRICSLRRWRVRRRDLLGCWDRPRRVMGGGRRVHTVPGPEAPPRLLRPATPRPLSNSILSRTSVDNHGVRPPP